MCILNQHKTGLILKMRKIILLISSLIMTSLLAACAPNLSPNTYSAYEVGATSTVNKGVIVSRRLVRIDNNSGVGGLAGTIGGAAAGSTIGHGSTANIAGAIGGAIVGGLIGNAVDESVNQQQGIEYIIRLETGKTVSVTQPLNMQFEIRQRVLVLFGSTTRVIPDNTPYYPAKRR